MRRDIVAVPYFTTARMQIQHTAQAQSWLDLGFRHRVRTGLVASRNWMTTTGAGYMKLGVRGGVARAGRIYLTLATMSGHAPGVPLPGGVLPLRPDAMTALLLEILGGPWPSRFVGVLDAAGNGGPSINFSPLRPLSSAFIGTRMSFATWVFDGTASAFGSPSNPRDLIFR